MAIKVSLKTRLTVWYSTIVVLSLSLFGVYMYLSVSNELHQNLDASIVNVAESLDNIIKENTLEALRPKAVKREKPSKEGMDKFAIFLEDEKRRFVGPLRPGTEPKSDEKAKSAVWSAIYEHILLEPKNYFIQISDTNNQIVWRSENLKSDSLPIFLTHTLEMQVTSDSVLVKGSNSYTIPPSIITLHEDVDSVFSYLNLNSQKLRLFIKRTNNAVISIGYASNVIDSQLRQLFMALLAAFPLILLVSVAGGIFLAKISLRPVDEITKTANEITAKHMNKRLPEHQINDEIGRLTKTLNEMIERLENSFIQTRQFSSDASHELKTPLTILKGELEIALHSRKKTEEYEAVIVSALEEVDRLSNVVETLLELSRADTGHVRLSMEEGNLTKIILDIVEDAVILAESKGLQVESNIEENVLLEFDSGRIHQAVLNIVDNAIKYTPEGGKISIGLTKGKIFTEIVVDDTGIGMDEAELSHIFDRFYRVDKARSGNVQGFGLGLSIVHWIIDAHRGKIHVKSEINRGTTFTILLPNNHEMVL
jgi:heavy metal sensor kinase